jgi:hypothetical protein
MQVKVPE